MELKDKHLEGFPGYMIFFDNTRVDQYVKGFNSNLHSDGSIGSASIEMIYIPDLYKVVKADRYGKITGVEKGIDNMTNLKIFVKNMFNDKYVMVFDGNIRGKSRNKSRKSMYFNARDYMPWLNRTIVPISLPLLSKITPGDALKWKAQGIDIVNVADISSPADGAFRGKTLVEFINNMKDKTLKLNKIYSDKNTVAYWDAVIDRIKIMGDISEDLIRNKIIDFVITSSATYVNSMYVGINDVAKNLMFEFYQDRDGVIRIKPPFWNEPILYDHVIDPSLIIDYNETVNWDNHVTRVVMTGGLEEYEEDLDGFSRDIITPTGAYVGSETGNSVWSDYNNTGTSKESVEVVGSTGGVSGVAWLDKWRITSGYLARGGQHKGVDFATPMRTPIYHIGPPGWAVPYAQTKGGNLAGYGVWVQVTIDDPSSNYDKHRVRYAHLDTHVIGAGVRSVGERHKTLVKDGDLIGYSGKTGAPVDPKLAAQFGPHLHFEVLSGGGTVDPLVYTNTVVGNITTYMKKFGDDKLLEPSEEERKYGISVFDSVQPLIKFSNSGDIMRDNSGRDALRKYSEFMYNLINSSTEVASIQVVGMPWIRPGFNIWVDPVGTDMVYYVNSVSHQGTPNSGVYTSLSLSMGRERFDFVSGSEIGRLNNKSDNIFINRAYQKTSDFGKVISNKAEFDSIRSECLDFYRSENNYIIKANKSSFYKKFYGITNSDNVTQKPHVPTSKVNVGKDEFNINSWPTLRQGSTGAYVSELQKALKRLGSYKESTFDQSFGPITKKSVVDFQTRFKLSIDGVVGPQTKQKMQDELLKIQGAVAATPQADFNFTGDKLQAGLFSGDYSATEIQARLNGVYSKAPRVISERVARTVTIMQNAKKYVAKHYETERTF